METDNVLPIVCGVLLLVGLLNIGLLVGVLRGRSRDRFEVIGRAIESARNPWRRSDEEYAELRKRIAELGEEETQD